MCRGMQGSDPQPQERSLQHTTALLATRESIHIACAPAFWILLSEQHLQVAKEEGSNPVVKHE